MGISTRYISDIRANYNWKVDKCCYLVEIKGTSKKGNKVNLIKCCNNDYCNLCGLEKCRQLAKKWKIEHAHLPWHYMLTLKFGDFQFLEQQQLCYEDIKRQIKRDDESAKFHKVNQWLSNRRHMHVIFSSQSRFSRKQLKEFRDYYFDEYHIPITSLATFGYERDTYADSFIDYCLRTGDKKPRWKKTHYPPMSECWSLTRTATSASRMTKRAKKLQAWQPTDDFDTM